MRIFVLLSSKTGRVDDMRTGDDNFTMPKPWVEKDSAFVADWQAKNPTPVEEPITPAQEKAELVERKQALESELAKVAEKIAIVDSKL